MIKICIYTKYKLIEIKPSCLLKLLLLLFDIDICSFTRVKIDVIIIINPKIVNTSNNKFITF